MFAAPEFNADPIVLTILRVIGDGDDPTPRQYKDRAGVYLLSHFSLDNMIKLPRPKFDHTYPYFDDAVYGDLECYGVCDTPEQFLERFGERLQADVRTFCMSFTHISKQRQPANGGWRWHKWGPYIGNGKLQAEYLYDEAGFEDGVYCYHILQLAGPIFKLTKCV